MKTFGIFLFIVFVLFEFGVLQAARSKEVIKRKKKTEVIFENDDSLIFSEGQEVFLEEIDISIKFNSLISDSRCPRDPTNTIKCITAGSASAEVEIKDGWVAKNSPIPIPFSNEPDERSEKEKLNNIGLSKVVLTIPGGTKTDNEENQSSTSLQNIFTTEKGHKIELLDILPYPSIDVNDDSSSILRNGGEVSNGNYDSAYSGPSDTSANTNEEDKENVLGKTTIIIKVIYNKDYSNFLNSRAKWQLRGIESRGYTVNYSKTCFCLPEWTAEMLISVNDKGQVTSATYKNEPMLGQVVKDSIKNSIPTIDEVFELIEEAYAASAAQISVKFDYLYGYPLNVYIDRSFMIADEENGLTFNGLKPFPLESENGLLSGSTSWSKRAIKKELDGFGM